MMHVFVRATAPIAASLRRVLPSVVLLLAAAALTPAQAQTAPAVSVHAGNLEYDLSGVTTVRHFAVRGEVPLAPMILMEGSLGYSRFGAGPEEHTPVITPEAQLHLQWPLGRVAPYLGAGAGALVAFASEVQPARDAELSLSAAGGVRIQLVDRLGARAELRVRGVGTRFEGSTSEWTAGLSWRL